MKPIIEEQTVGSSAAKTIVTPFISLWRYILDNSSTCCHRSVSGKQDEESVFIETTCFGFAEALDNLGEEQMHKPSHILPGQAAREANQNPLSPMIFPVTLETKKVSITGLAKGLYNFSSLHTSY